MNREYILPTFATSKPEMHHIIPFEDRQRIKNDPRAGESLAIKADEALPADVFNGLVTDETAVIGGIQRATEQIYHTGGESKKAA